MSYAFGAITLTDPPSLPLDPDGEIEDVNLRTPSTAGYTHTRPRFTRSRRRWGLRWIGMNNTDSGNLRTYERTTLLNGSASFSWVHPISGTYTVQLAGPIQFARVKSGVLTDVVLTLQEV